MAWRGYKYSCKYLSYREQGHSILEFSLVLPFVLMLLLGGIELSRMVKHYQVVTVISNEIASNAYRNCTTPHKLPNLQSCLQQTINETEIPTSGVLKNLRMLLTVWSWDGTQNKEVLLSSAVGQQAVVSRIDNGQGAFSGGSSASLVPLVQNQQLIAIAEVTATYNPVVPGIPNITDYVRGGEIYVPTVY